MSGRIGVIDIGSNSVRLVVYDALKRVPSSLFNEKMLCGLGRNLGNTGKLNNKATKQAERVLCRFVAMAEVMSVEHLHVFATAAIRDASDGPAFVAKLEEMLSVTIQVLSGDEEASYAGYGILAAMPNAIGIVGDLGGGSLELTRVSQRAIGNKASFPLGSLRLLPLAKQGEKYVRKELSSVLGKMDDFRMSRHSYFYAVGGGFRHLAKAYMTLNNYPLRILHHYAVPIDDFIPVAERIIRMSPAEIELLTEVPSKRAEALPSTAMLLKYIADMIEPSQIVFSAYGVREGVLFSQLSDEEKQKDPLIAGCIDMAGKESDNIEYGYELHNWMAPLFPSDPPEMERLRLAACILSDIARYEHIEYRADIAFRRFLDSSIPGINHAERLFVATALFYRYKSGVDRHILGVAGTLISEKNMQRARMIGRALRLAHNIAAGFPGTISSTHFDCQPNRIRLCFPTKSQALIGEAIEKRFEKLAKTMHCIPEIVVE